MSATYRAYRINVIVLVHEGQDVERDEKIVNSLATEISELASGDVIVINACPMKEI